MGFGGSLLGFIQMLFGMTEMVPVEAGLWHLLSHPA